MVILVFTCRVSLDNPFAWCGTLDDLFVVCPRNKSRPVGQAASGLGARGPLPLPGHVSPPLGSVAKDPRTTWSCIQLSGRRGSDSGHGSSHCSGHELTWQQTETTRPSLNLPLCQQFLSILQIISQIWPPFLFHWRPLFHTTLLPVLPWSILLSQPGWSIKNVG